jgi:3D (Asp-Asp-Asp) domain-containing protein
MNILSRKDKKQLLIIILVSLIYNFIIFPAQAATNDVSFITNDTVSIGINKVIIKKPNSQTNRLEQLNSDEFIDTKLTVVSDFKLLDDNNKKPSDKNPKTVVLNNNKTTDQPIIKGAKRTVTLTAYNSLPNQTDSDPCTTANGFNLCDSKTNNTIAANFLPFGSKVMIPDLFGDKVFVVRDRMNRRFSNRVDVWMNGHQEALNFGVQHASIVILEN